MLPAVYTAQQHVYTYVTSDECPRIRMHDTLEHARRSDALSGPMKRRTRILGLGALAFLFQRPVSLICEVCAKDLLEPFVFFKR